MGGYFIMKNCGHVLCIIRDILVDLLNKLNMRIIL